MANPNPDMSGLVPFKEGDDPRREGNGAKPGVPHSRTRLLKILTLLQKKENKITGEEVEMTVAEQMDMAQIVKAIDGDSKAYKEVIDRLEGKPIEFVDHSTKGESLNQQIIINPVIAPPLATSENDIDTTKNI